MNLVRGGTHSALLLARGNLLLSSAAPLSMSATLSLALYDGLHLTEAGPKTAVSHSSQWYGQSNDASQGLGWHVSLPNPICT